MGQAVKTISMTEGQYVQNSTLPPAEDQDQAWGLPAP